MNNKLASATGNKIEISKMNEQAVYSICITVKRLLYSEIEKGDLEFLKCAYDYLGLHDNRRIMEMSKKNYKAELSVIHDILLDIVAVLLEEIKVNHNDGFLKMLVEHYMKKYPSVESDMKKYNTVSDYLTAHAGKEPDECALVMLCYQVSGRLTEEELKGLKPLQGNVPTRYDLACIKGMLEKRFKIENLDQNKMYQRFIKRMKKEVCDYLNISEDKFEEYVLDQFFNVKAVKDDKSRMCIMIQHIHYRVWDGYMDAEFTYSNNSDLAQTVRRVFEIVCIELIVDRMGKRLVQDISQINSLVKIEDMDAFFCTFFSALVFDFYIDKVGSVVNECYEGFSFDSTDRDREKELLIQIDTLKRQHKDKTDKMQSELDEKNEKLVRLAEQGFESRQKEQSAVDKQTAEYKKEISRLKKQMDNIQHDLEDAKKQVQSRDEFIKVLSAREDDVADDTEIDMQKLWTKRYLFVGNVKEAMPYLREDFSDSIFMDNENYNLKNIKVDKVIVFTGYISHGMFYKIKNVLKDVPVIWCNSKNKDIVYRKMQKAV